jgi:hypothetical protein
VDDNTVVVTGVRFTSPDFMVARTNLADQADSRAAGRRLATALKCSGLTAVFVLAPGVGINGSALIEGMQCVLGDDVVLSGGLAGDGGRFSGTLTICDEHATGDGIVAVGFRGSRIRLTHGSYGGWQPFGPKRKVTRAAGNILYELDGKPALRLYKRYLGEYAKDLPGSGLLFPFAMLDREQTKTGLIRTILGIDEATDSLILAGDVTEQGFLQLMQASTNLLIEGAEVAAKMAVASAMPERAPLPPDTECLGLLVSCIGRKLVMGTRVDEEVESVGAVLGDHAVLAGFYSNGEISPHAATTKCRLHNQTMTITCIHEQ